MLGILVILVGSWVLLHLSLKKNLLVLGLTPISNRAIQFLIGLIFMSFLCLITIGFDTLVYSIQWHYHSQTTIDTFISSIWYYLKSALTEDLVFRGALLYLLITKFNARLGLLISAIAFGIYHWFSYGMLDSEIKLVPLVYVFIVTGFTGYAWAYAFMKTNSILMPLGFHLGWNQTLILFYKNNSYSELLFQEVSKTEVNEWLNLLYLLTKAVLIPIMTMLFINLIVKKPLHNPDDE